MTTLTPTTRTLRKLAADGWMADIVERWIRKGPFQKPTTKDLFGIGDILAVKNSSILLIQATTGANGAARVTKIKAEPRTRRWLCAALIEVWAWRELKGKGWQPKITEITLADLQQETV